MNESSQPQLSIIVAIVSDTIGDAVDLSQLDGCLASIAAQEAAPPLEVIVPHRPDLDLTQLAARNPDVRFLRIDDLATYTGRSGSREHHDELRARGLQAARGTLVGLIEDHARPDPRWCAEASASRRDGVVGIGGAMDNDIERSLNYAVFLCDFYRYQNPVREGPTEFASDANVWYEREALERIREVWERSFHEPAVNQALRAEGGEVILSPRVIVYQARQGLRPGSALRERFVWGNSFAATRASSLTLRRRLALAALTPVLPVVLSFRILQNARLKRHLDIRLAKSFPWVVLLVTAWSLGELVGTLNPSRS